MYIYHGLFKCVSLSPSYLNVRPYAYLSVYHTAYICLSVCLSLSLYIYIYTSVFLPVFLCNCLLGCKSIYISYHIYGSTMASTHY